MEKIISFKDALGLMIEFEGEPKRSVKLYRNEEGEYGLELFIQFEGEEAKEVKLGISAESMQAIVGMYLKLEAKATSLPNNLFPQRHSGEIT